MNVGGFYLDEKTQSVVYFIDKLFIIQKISVLYSIHPKTNIHRQNTYSFLLGSGSNTLFTRLLLGLLLLQKRLRSKDLLL